MIIFVLRLFIFTLLPVLVAAILVRIDRFARTLPAKLELFLIYSFGLGVVAGGLGNFIGHVFLADEVARLIGWPTGSPFQQEMGFANLAFGVLGLIAATRRDGFREATVIAITVVGVGATIVHLVDIVQTGNLAPGNTVQNVSNLTRPALLIGFLWASRRADARAGAPSTLPGFDAWQARHAQAAGWLAGIVAGAFGIGYAFDQPLLGTLFGLAIGTGVMALLFRRIQAGLQDDLSSAA